MEVLINSPVTDELSELKEAVSICTAADPVAV